MDSGLTNGDRVFGGRAAVDSTATTWSAIGETTMDRFDSGWVEVVEGVEMFLVQQTKSLKRKRWESTAAYHKRLRKLGR